MSLGRCFLLGRCPSHACPNLATCYGWLIIFDGALFLMVRYYQSEANLQLRNACMRYSFSFIRLHSFLFPSISSSLPQLGPITEYETPECSSSAKAPLFWAVYITPSVYDLFDLSPGGQKVTCGDYTMAQSLFRPIITYICLFILYFKNLNT